MVTFSLDGFSRVVRDGIELPSNFTATVDVTMGLSALEETVTVSGQSPVIDVTQTQRTTVFNRELMNAIPTSNNMWSFAQLAPGVTMNGVDVAGSSNGSDRELSAHGLSSTHTIMAVDGMNVNTTRADGRAALYFQDLSNEEVVLDTAGGSAEVSSGGLRINMIPRDGGNQQSGLLFIGGTPGSWQADNFTQRLKDAGMKSVDKIERIFDYGGTVGGPSSGIDCGTTSRRGTGAHMTCQPTISWTTAAHGAGMVTDGRCCPGSRFRRRRGTIAIHYERTAQFRGPRLQATYPAVINGLGRDPETASQWRDPKGKFQNNGYGLAPTYLITRTTTYTAEQCAGRPCTAGALVIPGMVLSSLTIPLAPAGTEIFLPRLNQLDMGVKKTFGAGGVSWEPRLDIFNVLNADTEITYRSTQFGSPVYLFPGTTSTLAGTAGILVARMWRASLQVRW